MGKPAAVKGKGKAAVAAVSKAKAVVAAPPPKAGLSAGTIRSNAAMKFTELLEATKAELDGDKEAVPDVPATAKAIEAAIFAKFGALCPPPQPICCSSHHQDDRGRHLRQARPFIHRRDLI